MDSETSPRVLPRDVQQLLGVKEEVPSEKQEDSSSVDQQEPEAPPHIKEEQEDLCISQEGEQLQGLEEADITKFPFTPVPVKREDDEEEAQSLQIHQRPSQQMETKADGEECRRLEPARNSHPLLQPDTEDQTGDPSEPETDDSADWKETREPQSALNSLKHDSRCKKRFSCSECGRRFGRKSHLKNHMMTHTGEKPFSCSVCNTSFSQSGDLQKHMRVHTGEKPFSCPVCNTSFTQSENLRSHMRTHTGEKPFSCSECGRAFTERGNLKKHMITHTGEKLFSCSVCNTTFTRRGSLRKHMAVHTSEKRFSCSVCNKRFAWRSDVKKHICVGPMETEADGEDRGGPEPARNSNPLLQPETEDQIGNSSEPETGDSADWKETREPQPALNSLKHDSRCDVQQLLVVKEEVPPEEQEYSSSLDQQEPESPPHIKEEQEELCFSQEGEQLQGLEEADITKFSFTPTPMRSEDDEEEALSSHLDQRQTQHMETEADGEDCGGPEPVRNSHPVLQPETDDSADSDFWKETRQHRKHEEVLMSEERCKSEKKSFSCFECGNRFTQNSSLHVHMRIHTGQKPFSCSVCKKLFLLKGQLQSHMRTHTGAKPFSCSVCRKSFTQKGSLQSHMRTHTREKRFSCSVCDESFLRKQHLKTHMAIHTGEKLQCL